MAPGITPSRAVGPDHEPDDRLAVSVIVPHYQDLTNLAACLELLGRQTLPAHAFEVIVVDNMSPVGLASVESVVAGRATVLECPLKGAGPTRNTGAARARGAVLAFLDSDCRPAADWLDRGLAAIAPCSVIGGRVDVLVDDPSDLSAVEAFELVFAFDNERYVRQEGFSVSANLFVKRHVWEAVGPFRDGVSEDVDWCWRARDAGHPVTYAPDAVVGHPARRTWSELARKWRRMTREGFLLSYQTPFGLVRWFARSTVVLASAIGHLPRVIWTPKLERSRDRLRAAGVLCSIRAYRFIDGLRVPFERRKARP